MTGARSGSGQVDARGLRVALVASRFNDAVVDGLVAGARQALAAHGADAGQIDLYYVPGAWELPLAAQGLARAGRHDAIVALGAVIRGETAHFDHIAGQCAAGLSRVALDHRMPVAFGVLTCDTPGQARQRSGPDEHNKGAEAAVAAIEMARLLHDLEA